MKDCEILDFVSQMGKMLLENGAETYRVEDTLSRVLKCLGATDYDTLSTSTGLFVCVKKHTKILRVKTRTINLYRISQINDLSRKIVENQIDIDTAKQKLKHIQNETLYKPSTITISIGVACFFFAFLFKGNIKDAFSAFIVGFLLNIFNIFLSKRKISNFLQISLDGLFVALISLINLNIGIGSDVHKVIIASVMPLVPGVCFTNAIRDIFEGDYISGGSRIFEAIVIGIAISIGVGSVLLGWLNIFGDFYIGG